MQPFYSVNCNLNVTMKYHSWAFTYVWQFMSQDLSIIKTNKFKLYHYNCLTGLLLVKLQFHQIVQKYKMLTMK